MMAHDSLPRPLKLRVGFRTRTVYGGPHRPHVNALLKNTFTVDLTGGPFPDSREGTVIDWPDFGLPEDVRFPLYEALRALVNGRSLYVGCGWGRGRTGTFLALLAKILGEKQPVLFVRTNYLAEAVETPEQKKFVEEYDVGDSQYDLRYLLRERRRGFWLREVGY